MESNEAVLVNKQQFEKPFSDKIREHGELAAALLSGVLILFGWLLQHQGMSRIYIGFYILAFVIGGFAKAKEGIEETIADKTLNVELLMVLAAIGSAIIGYWTEGAILIFIFSLSGALETYTMNKSKREISSLLDLQPEEATLLKNGIEERVPVSELDLADFILVKPGERIPADGKIEKGKTAIDQSAITGESIPVEKKAEDEVFAGTVNVNGSITVKVTKKSSETLFQKILAMVQSAQSEKSPSQQFIERFEGTYVKAVLAAVALMLFIPHFVLGWSWSETFYRAMVLMVVASPCALVASIMPATLSAISNGARNGLLFKGGMHLEQLSKATVIAFDKTGTLTKGEPEVTDAIVREDLDERDFYQAVLSLEKQSNHPLAKAIVKYISETKPSLKAEWLAVDEQSGFGVSAEWNNQIWKVGRAELVGKTEADQFAGSRDKSFAREGKSIVYVKDENGIAGLLALKDVIRQETADALKDLKEQGIKTVMLTGDSEETAKAIASESGVNEFVANCLPEDKVTEVKKLEKDYGTVAMIGDGINDAPALAASNIGIAMGEGTDVALETADIVLMKNELSKLTKAISLSKRMNRIIKQNIVFSLAMICLLICTNFLQVLDLPIGVIGHEGSTILVILNGLRLLR
ncbi:heavy metal translocating P-type ATPase [Metabacillus sp. RGM 3146]|uniref:heavy metal translocating P-type ATPase n=1 Tax=Metabacillus sp. RGM 3146 TaxID=3401092 RepID=UPI003B9A6D9D